MLGSPSKTKAKQSIWLVNMEVQQWLQQEHIHWNNEKQKMN